PAEVGAARGTVGRGGEPGVAAPAARAGDRQHALARHREVADERARVAVGDHGADRNAQDQVLPRGAVAVRALAVRAPLGVVVALVVEIQEGSLRGIRLEPEALAVATVAAGHTAPQNL